MRYRIYHKRHLITDETGKAAIFWSQDDAEHYLENEGIDNEQCYIEAF